MLRGLEWSHTNYKSPTNWSFEVSDYNINSEWITVLLNKLSNTLSRLVRLG